MTTLYINNLAIPIFDEVTITTKNVTQGNDQLWTTDFQLAKSQEIMRALNITSPLYVVGEGQPIECSLFFNDIIYNGLLKISEINNSSVVVYCEFNNYPNLFNTKICELTTIDKTTSYDPDVENTNDSYFSLERYTAGATMDDYPAINNHKLYSKGYLCESTTDDFNHLQYPISDSGTMQQGMRLPSQRLDYFIDDVVSFMGYSYDYQNSTSKLSDLWLTIDKLQANGFINQQWWHWWSFYYDSGEIRKRVMKKNFTRYFTYIRSFYNGEFEDEYGLVGYEYNVNVSGDYRIKINVSSASSYNRAAINFTLINIDTGIVVDTFTKSGHSTGSAAHTFTVNAPSSKYKILLSIEDSWDSPNSELRCDIQLVRTTQSLDVKEEADFNVNSFEDYQLGEGFYDGWSKNVLGFYSCCDFTLNDLLNDICFTYNLRYEIDNENNKIIIKEGTPIVQVEGELQNIYFGDDKFGQTTYIQDTTQARYQIAKYQDKNLEEEVVMYKYTMLFNRSVDETIRGIFMSGIGGILPIQSRPLIYKHLTDPVSERDIPLVYTFLQNTEQHTYFLSYLNNEYPQILKPSQFLDYSKVYDIQTLPTRSNIVVGEFIIQNLVHPNYQIIHINGSDWYIVNKEMYDDGTTKITAILQN